MLKTIRGQDIHLEFQIAEKSNNSEHFKRTHKGTFVVSLMTRNAEVKNVSVKSEAIVVILDLDSHQNLI